MAMAMGIVGCAWDARTTMLWARLEWLERATLSPGSYTALIATLPMLDALYTDLCVQGGTVEGDHYYHHVNGHQAHPSSREWGWLERPEKLAVPCSPASQEATEALIATDMLSHAAG